MGITPEKTWVPGKYVEELLEHHVVDHVDHVEVEPGRIDDVDGAARHHAVLDAIDSGVVGALALDVYESEASLFFEDLSEIPFERRRHLIDRRFQLLMSYPNVLVTPHGEVKSFERKEGEGGGKGDERRRVQGEKKCSLSLSVSLSLKK